MRAVGSSIPRFDAAEKVTGQAAYPADIDLPNQAWLKIVFAGVPHARIVRMDTARSAAADGVIAILTAADVPVNEYGLVMPDQPVLCGLGSTPQAAVVRWEGDKVALIVAETAAQAEAAAQLLDIEYETLPVITNTDQALAADAQPLHPHPFSNFPYEERDRQSNLLVAHRLRCGDIAAGFAQADVCVEGVYSTHPQEHAYLQPEAGLAHLRADGRIEVIVAGQWMHEDQEQIAHSLDLPRTRSLCATRLSAALSAGGRICRCRSRWRWRPGRRGARSRRFGAGRSRLSGTTSGIRSSCAPSGGRPGTVKLWPRRWT